MDYTSKFSHNFNGIPKDKVIITIIILFVVLGALVQTDIHYSKGYKASGVIIDKTYYKREQRTPHGPILPAKYIFSVRVKNDILEVLADTNKGRSAQLGQNVTFISSKGCLTHYTYVNRLLK